MSTKTCANCGFSSHDWPSKDWDAACRFCGINKSLAYRGKRVSPCPVPRGQK